MLHVFGRARRVAGSRAHDLLLSLGTRRRTALAHVGVTLAHAAATLTIGTVLIAQNPVEPPQAPTSRPVQATPAQDGDRVSTQDPTTAPPAKMPRDFERLLAAVDTAHRSESRGKVYDRFAGNLSIVPLAEGQDPIEIQLSAKFLAPRALRYRVEEGGRQIERGSEPDGVLWGRNADRTYRLVGREFREEQRTLESHVGLARQLLTFLDPAATLRDLRDVSPVTDAELTVGRRRFTGCQHVMGTLDDFPLFVGEGKARRVRLELWTQEGLLTAVRAGVLSDEGLVERAEFVLLEDYRSLDGAEVPTRLTVFEEPVAVVSAPGGAASAPTRTPLARIEISSLDLDPELSAADFARPQ